MKLDFTWLADGPGQLMLAGLAGGIVRWATLREKWPDGLISLLVGTICAVYIGPAAFPLMGALVDVTGINENSANALAGFMIGAGGILVSGFVIDIWKERRRQLKAAAKISTDNFVVMPAPNPEAGSKTEGDA